MLFYSLSLIGFFILSAFFSAAEISLFSLEKNKIKSRFSNNPLISRYLIHLIEYPRRLLVTILICTTLVSVAASIVAVEMTIRIADNFPEISLDVFLTGQIIILTLFVVLFGELVPKVMATGNPWLMAKITCIPMYWISIVFYPVAETITEFINISTSKFKVDRTKMVISQEELTELADLSHERGAIVEEEHGLISGIVGFRTVAVREIMTPRVDMNSVSSESTFDEIINVIKSSGHSRIPLYEEDIDKIAGIIYSKDLLPYIYNNELRKTFNPLKIYRKVMFIPETKMISDLLVEFQEKKMHLAIVVDEYGGTSGLITLEDILEEVIGEIRDEYDKEENPIQPLSDKSYLVLGKTTVDQLNDFFEMKIIQEEADFETLAGLVLNNAGYIPKEGYSFVLSGYKFIVKEVFKKRIIKVLIEKII